MAQNLREEPGTSVEGERGPERRADVEQVREAHDHAQLEQAEGERCPAGLVPHEPVVGGVEEGSDAEHEPCELDRPPRLQHERENAPCDEWSERGRDPRLDAPSQRVRHAFTFRRKRRAAYLAPVSVSAAGNAH